MGATGGGRGGPLGGESEPGKWNQGTVRDLHHSYHTFVNQGGRHRCFFTRLRYCIQVWAIILTTCPVGVMLPLSTHPQCWDGRISYQTEEVSKTDLWKRKLWNIRPLHNRSTKEKTGSRRMEEGYHGSGSESALCVAGRREREGRRQKWGSACGGEAPRNVGKKRQFSYWCPWPAEEEQTKVLTSRCAPVGVGEWICQLSTPNKLYLQKIYVCMFWFWHYNPAKLQKDL